MTDVTVNECPCCGANLDEEALRSNKCRYCKNTVIITTASYLEKFEPSDIKKYIAKYSQVLRQDPENMEALQAVGICYLKLGLFDLAEKILGKLVDCHPMEAGGYYYQGIALLKGKKPRIASMKVVREVERLISTACELEPENGRNDALLAVVRHDYYVRNGLRIPDPNPRTLIGSALSKHLDRLEAEQIFVLLNVDDPSLKQMLLG